MSSQFNESEIIKNQFPKGFIGTCVEVGAANGIDSNTLDFESRGWTAVCIEPNEELFNQCKRIRKISLNYAVGEKNLNNQDFNIVTLTNGNEMACSGLKVDKRLIQQHKKFNPLVNVVKVNVRTLDTILNDLNIEKIDFISIDTEGTEKEVLKGFNIPKYRPRVMVIENNFDNREVEKYLKSFEYKKFLREKVNDFYIDSIFCVDNSLHINDNIKLRRGYTNEKVSNKINGEYFTKKKPGFFRRLEQSIRKRRKRFIGWISNFSRQRVNIDKGENAQNEVTHNRPGFFRRLERSIRKRRKRFIGWISNFNRQRLNINMRKKVANEIINISKNAPNEIINISENTPNEIILNSDYGIESNAWHTFRKKLLETLENNKLSSVSKNKKLWICIVDNNESAEGIDSNIESNIHKIIDNGVINIGCIIISNKRMHKSSFKALSAKNVKNIQQIPKMINEDDAILFVSEGDNLDPAMIQILEKNDGFSADFLLFDFYYEQGSQAYPVLLHGVDPLHARYCDYFFSRFMVNGGLLMDATKKCKKVTLRNIALACFDLAVPSKIKHIPIPLLSAGLTKEMVHLAKSKITHPKRQKREYKSKVSAIICTKDNNFILQQLLHCLQNERTIKEIIIVANNSTSKNMELLLEKLKSTKAAKIIKYDKAFNFSRQCNIASSIATGTNLLFLNDDIAPSSENWIEILTESSMTNNGSISGPLLIYPDQTVQHGGMFLGFRNIAGHMMRHSSIPDATSNFLLNAPRKVSCLTGAVLMIPRTVFENLNGFDDNLGTYLQDVDLCLRATEIGVDLVFDPRSVLIHFESTTVKTILSDDKIMKTREREYVYFRSRWPNLKDNYFNKNLSLDDEHMKKLKIP